MLSRLRPLKLACVINLVRILVIRAIEQQWLRQPLTLFQIRVRSHGQDVCGMKNAEKDYTHHFNAKYGGTHMRRTRLKSMAGNRFEQTIWNEWTTIVSSLVIMARISVGRSLANSNCPLTDCWIFNSNHRKTRQFIVFLSLLYLAGTHWNETIAIQFAVSLLSNKYKYK